MAHGVPPVPRPPALRALYARLPMLGQRRLPPIPAAFIASSPGGRTRGICAENSRRATAESIQRFVAFASQRYLSSGVGGGGKPNEKVKRYGDDPVAEFNEELEVAELLSVCRLCTVQPTRASASQVLEVAPACL